MLKKVFSFFKEVLFFAFGKEVGSSPGGFVPSAETPLESAPRSPKFKWEVPYVHPSDFSESQRIDLISLTSNRGFEALRSIMEDQIRKANVDLISTPPSHKNEVASRHAQVYNMAAFYTRIMKDIEFQVGEHLRVVGNAELQKKILEMSPEELMRFV